MYPYLYICIQRYIIVCVGICVSNVHMCMSVPVQVCMYTVTKYCMTILICFYCRLGCIGVCTYVNVCMCARIYIQLPKYCMTLALSQHYISIFDWAASRPAGAAASFWPQARAPPHDRTH